MSAKIYTFSTYKKASSADEIEKHINEIIQEMLEELDGIIVAAEEEHQNAAASGKFTFEID